MTSIPGDPRRLLPLLICSLLPGAFYGWRTWGGYPDTLFGLGDALVVRDYINIWAGGELVREGRFLLAFQPHEYWEWLRSAISPELALHTWSYPPHMLLVAAPFASMPLMPGFFAWTVGSAALLWCVLRGAGLPGPLALAVVLSPAALDSALAGQNGAFTAAALAGGLLLADRRPVLAGALLGLLSLKPQLGLLVPLCFSASRNLRAFGWTAVFVAAYCAASVAAFGLEAWKQFFDVTTPFMRLVLEADSDWGFHFEMPTPFISARMAGASVAAAYVVQGVVTLCSAALVWMAWARPVADREAAVALTLILAPLSTPYSHSYDLVCVAVAVVLLARLRIGRGFPPAEFRSLFAAWLWPGAAFHVGAVFCPGLGPLVLLPAAVCAWRRLSRNSEAVRHPVEAPRPPRPATAPHEWRSGLTGGRAADS